LTTGRPTFFFFQKGYKEGTKYIFAEKWYEPYSTVRDFIHARMSIALPVDINRCIRGSRIPATQISTDFVEKEVQAFTSEE